MNNQGKPRFRIFVSYSHGDRDLVEKVVAALEATGMEPVWDKNIQPGMPFTEAIKIGITLAHVFMPIITKESQERPWVHQETGYAIALNIPVLPLAVGNLPSEMIAQLQAVSVKADLSDLFQKLDEVNFEPIVSPSPPGPRGIVEIAEWPETRTELMAQYAKWVIELGEYGRLRQRGGISSFGIPDRDVNDPIWERRDSTNPRSEYYHYLQREERRALERHARECGCSLIIDPAHISNILTPIAGATRISILLEFLESIPNEKICVVIATRASAGSLTILGNWFVAESRLPRPGQGYRQTIFNWHAPTVFREIRKFDQVIEELLEQRRLEPEATREIAIKEIKELIDKLHAQSAVRPPEREASGT